VRVLFFGTSEFACSSLEMLLKSPHEVIGVVTQPDRPKGRGKKIASSPIKLIAQKNNLPIFQPEKVRDPSAVDTIKSLAPEIIVVVAFGQILTPAVLSIPPRGCINVHGSLLPKYRGAAPIARAILAGEKQTGVTTMFMDAGMDTGPILLTEETDIDVEDTAKTLHDLLAHIGAHLLRKTLEGLEKGTIAPQPQDSAQATLAPKIEREEARIHWEKPAAHLFNLLRAFDPWPGAFTSWQGKILKMFRPQIREGRPVMPHGSVVQVSPEGITVATKQGFLVIREIQMENRPRMKVAEFLRGNPLEAGERLGS
jgi:methionyl-tRNA formyltransferase